MFSAPTREWFSAAFPEPTPVQRLGWDVITSGKHGLLVAPTGSGKTLAAFLAGIDTVSTRGDESPGTRVLYVSPLKALVYDIERNLRAPLIGIQRTAERLGVELPPVRVAVRTGDTPPAERRRQVRDPGEILVTTPESLYLILGSQARETLTTVHTVIVDEVHAIASSKRGSHLAVSLERLAELTEADPQRIGLSATVRPLSEIARFLGGNRPVEVVDASRPPSLDLKISVPVPDMTNLPLVERNEQAPGSNVLAGLYEPSVHTPPAEAGIWPAIYPKILEEIQAGRSTLVFANSRGLCERLAQRLNELSGEDLVRAHHGSVSHEKRAEIEEGLKSGTIRAIVATSSLELGIDMGAIDRVLLVESPGSVARGLQRVGRAGHRVGDTSIGRVYPKHRHDLLECAVLAERMQRAELESIRVPQNPLDVLAQQIVAMCCDRERTVDEVFEIVRRSDPYRDLTRASLEAVLDMLTGRYLSTEFANLRPWLKWDRQGDVLAPRRGTEMVTRMNAGTIPDRGTYSVHVGEGGRRVGELDEEMVYESRVGENIMLGATTWRIEEITRDRVHVAPAPGEPGKLPFWHGDGPGRPVEVGQAIGQFLRELSERSREEGGAWIREKAPLDDWAVDNLLSYLDEQRTHVGALPTDRRICVERFRDEIGDWRVCILTPMGSRIHAPWALALQRGLSERAGFEIQVSYSDDGIVLRFADTEQVPELESLFPSAEDVEDLVTEQLADSALFAGLFRENAVRALLLTRRSPKQRNPLWVQRLKSSELLASVRRYPTFPIVLETYRQAIADVFDVPALTTLLRDVESGRVTIHESESPTASPFARGLVFSYVAQHLYEVDAPAAERRAHALTVDRGLLAELLGNEGARELLDMDEIRTAESRLQATAEDFSARDEDEVHDLLRRIGDLSLEEVGARVRDMDPQQALDALEREKRAVSILLANETRWIAADEAGLYRDAFGCVPPQGLPVKFLEPEDQAVERVFRRFARRRGPFGVEELAHRYGWRAEEVSTRLDALVSDGILVRGALDPSSEGLDYCDGDVLRRLKRATLARVRREIAPVSGESLGVFLPQWHGIDSEESGPDRLLSAVSQLEGLALPWDELASRILPARVSGFRVEDLDYLSTSGAIVWVGRGGSGLRGGRVALYRRDRVAALYATDDEAGPSSEVANQILELLRERGASFSRDIERNVRATQSRLSAQEYRAGLWELVWAGLVTNDTFSVLRERGTHSRRVRRSRVDRTAWVPAGRWFLVEDLLRPAVEDTERALAQARSLLERYGIVSREAASQEGLPGGFSAAYRVLSAMEERGQVRRGYFVESLEGAQFASAPAVDRLRACRTEETRDDALESAVLAAIDPANPYGACLPWPQIPGVRARPRRIAGATVCLLGGALSLWMGANAQKILTFPVPGLEESEVVRRSLGAIRSSRAGGRRMRIEEINGEPALDSSILPTLRECGFVTSYRGLVDTQV